MPYSVISCNCCEDVPGGNTASRTYFKCVLNKGLDDDDDDLDDDFVPEYDPFD